MMQRIITGKISWEANCSRDIIEQVLQFFTDKRKLMGELCKGLHEKLYIKNRWLCNSFREEETEKEICPNGNLHRSPIRVQFRKERIQLSQYRFGGRNTIKTYVLRTMKKLEKYQIIFLEIAKNLNACTRRMKEEYKS